MTNSLSPPSCANASKRPQDPHMASVYWVCEWTPQPQHRVRLPSCVSRELLLQPHSLAVLVRQFPLRRFKQQGSCRTPLFGCFFAHRLSCSVPCQFVFIVSVFTHPDWADGCRIAWRRSMSHQRGETVLCSVTEWSRSLCSARRLHSTIHRLADLLTISKSHVLDRAPPRELDGNGHICLFAHFNRKPLSSV